MDFDELVTAFLTLWCILAVGAPPHRAELLRMQKQLVSAIPATPWNPLQCTRFPLFIFCICEYPINLHPLQFS